MAAAAAGGAGGGIGSSSTGGYGLAGGPSLGAVLGGTRGGPMLDGKGMTFLERTHPVLESILTRRFDDSAKVDDVDSKIVDFDEVTYRVIARADEKDVTYVCGSFPFFAHLRGHGVDEVLASKFPGLVVAPIEGSDVTIRVPTPTGDAKARSVLLADLARLRELVFGAPFRKAFEKMKEGGMGEAVEIRYRPLEAVWIIPRRARVTVIFSLACKDAMDRAIARVIATEFSEAQRKASSAPPVTFTEPNADVPMELRGRTIGACPELVGYLSFAFQPEHVDTPAKIENAVGQLVLFRAYLLYHIKAAKTYLHARMRFRVDSLLQVLRRAQPEDPFGGKEKKLISGKTFKRK